jgi:hypothetical protein
MSIDQLNLISIPLKIKEDLKRSPLFFVCCLLLFISWGCDDDDGNGGSGDIANRMSAILAVSPTQIDLPAIPPGESVTRAVELKNVGESSLRVIGLDFSSITNQIEFTKEHPEVPFSIAPNESVTLNVNYSPTNEGADEGAIEIVSNSAQRTTVIPIRTLEGQSDLFYTGSHTFVLNPCDASVFEWHQFQNVGVVPIVIEQVGLDANTSSAFTIEQYRMVRNTNPEPEMIASPEGITLAQGDSIEVGIRFAPQGQSILTGALEFSYEDDEFGPRRVQLEGVEYRPQVEILPPGVEFGAHDLDVSSPITEVTLINHNREALNIERVDLAVAMPGVSEQFTLHDIELPQVIEPEESFMFGVSYTPAMEGSHITSIAVTFGECQGQVTIPISGRLKEPCIQATPELVNFGTIAQGQPSAPYLVEILNCGDIPIDINEVDFADGVGGFSWQWVDPNITTPFVLDTISTQLLEVTYTNRGLSEGNQATDTLVINNSTPDTSELEVAMLATGGGAPTCNMQIIPNRMNFGLVSRGRSVTRELRAVNRGTGTCELRNQEVTPLIDLPIPGFSQTTFELTQPIAANQAAAAQFLSFEVTYTPELFNADAAQYKLTYYDPFLNEERVAVGDLAGISGESNIEVIPGRLDFGQVTAGDCASREERVTVYNTGIVDLCITGMMLEGPDCSEFLITDRPVADQDGCIVVTRNNPADVQMVYEPGDLGPDECELVFISDAADTPELRVPLEGEGVSNSTQVDEFVQTSGQTVDVLFVVDDSGSMSEEQDNLARNFTTFINGAQQFQNDYQIGVITTDMDDTADAAGQLQGSPRIIERTPSVSSQFERSVSVGTRGSGTERGLAAAQAALSDPLAYDTGVTCSSDANCSAPDTCVEGYCGGANRGFLREEAALEVVFVSDEDDFSDASLNFYIDFFKNIKGFRNESRFHAHAIVGASNGRASSCSGGGGEASAGSRYVEVANRTNGQVYSICDDDFGRPLQEIGNQAFGLPVQFFLTRPADRNTLSVFVNDAQRNSGWTYDAPSNSIIFDEASVPAPGQRVRVEYDAQCFPRRGG